MKRIKENKTYYFQCDCSSQEHTLGVEFDLEDKEVVVHVQLARHNNFFQRLKLAVKYLLGYQCKYGHWDTAIMKEETFMDMYNVMTRYVYTAGFTNKAAIKIKKALEDIKQGKQNSAVPRNLHYNADRTNSKKL